MSPPRDGSLARQGLAVAEEVGEVVVDHQLDEGDAPLAGRGPACAAKAMRVHLRVEPGMYHGADAVPGVKDSDRIRAFHADMSSSLRHALDLVESSHEPRDRSRDEATDGA